MADLDSGGENPSARLPELAGRFVYLVGFAETEIDRPNEQSPISDLIHRPSAVRRRGGELHLVKDVRETPQRLLERATAPELGQHHAAGRPLPAEPDSASFVSCLSRGTFVSGVKLRPASGI